MMYGPVFSRPLHYYCERALYTLGTVLERLFVGRNSFVYCRQSLPRSPMYPIPSTLFCFSLVYAHFSASGLLLRHSCFFSAAVSLLLFPSCFFQLYYFSCFFSLLSLLLHLLSSFSSVFLSRSFFPDFSVLLFFPRSLCLDPSLPFLSRASLRFIHFSSFASIVCFAPSHFSESKFLPLCAMPFSLAECSANTASV